MKIYFAYLNVRLLMLKERRSRCFSLPAEAGSVPVKPLPSQYENCRAGKLSKMSSTGPESAQKLQLNWMSLCNLRMSGNPPVNGFRPSLNVIKSLSWSRACGMVPWM